MRPSKTSTELGRVKVRNAFIHSFVLSFILECGTRPSVITRSLTRGRSILAPSYLRVDGHGTRLGDLPGLRARVTVTVGSRVRLGVIWAQALRLSGLDASPRWYVPYVVTMMRAKAYTRRAR